jgi:hypothetical protein
LPDELNFAFVPVGQSKSLGIKVRNNGDTDFQITGASKTSGVDFSFDDFGGSTYPIVVAPGTQVSGSVTFAPTTGEFLTDTLTINTDAGDVAVDMFGTGVGPIPDIHVTPTSVNFGTASSGTVVSKDLTVSNTGSAPLTISAVDFTDPNLSSTSVFPIIIAPAGSTTLNITWTAPAVDADLDTQAVIASDDPDESAVAIHVTASSLQCSFADDFEAATIDFTKWTVLSGNFSQVGGDMIGSDSSKKAKIIATGFVGCAANCTIHTTMAANGLSGNKVSLVGWYTSKSNNVEVKMIPNSGQWQIIQASNGSKKKVKVNSPISPNQVYDVVLAFDGTNFTLTVDSVLLATLPKISGSNPSGTAGYFVVNGNGNFSFICIQ